MDPRSRLILLLCVGALAVTLERAGPLLVLTLLCAVALGLARVPARRLGQGAAAAAALVWGTVISQGLFFADVPRVAWFTVGDVVIWREGVLWGLVQSLRLLATLCAGIALAATTSPDRLYGALVAFRVPFGLAFLAVTALRAAPDTLRAMWTVRTARALRGRPAWQRSPMAWLRLEVGMLRPVVAEALRRAHTLAEALDARGFDPAQPRRIEQAPTRAAERALVALAVGGTGALVGARLLFALYVAELLYLPGLRPLYAWVRATL